MARYKGSDALVGQGLFLSVQLKEQLLPGSFEQMLDEIIDKKIDMSIFDRKYNNDQFGARAIPPSVLLKLVIYGYSKGLTSSRELWELNRHNMVAKALTGGMDIHWTTIASFVSGCPDEFSEVFVKVLMYCNELGLVGGETFAIDGYRLPSNASKELSGKHEDLEKKYALYCRMAERHAEKHRKKDALGELDEHTRALAAKRQKRLQQKMSNIDNFFGNHEKKIGKNKQELVSNVTDNESGLLRTPDEGYIQGYVGIAVADAKAQVIVSAEAVGNSSECGYFPGVARECVANLREAGVTKCEQKTILADGGYFSEDNLRVCEELGMEGIIPDSQEKKRSNVGVYSIDDFVYHEADDYYECPQGKKLSYKGVRQNGKRKAYRASIRDCRECPCLSKCIKTKKEQNALKCGRALTLPNDPSGSLCQKMREKFEQEEYKERYSCRFQIIEPVFANIGYSKGMNRFNLRGKKKVNGQWLLFCMVHNLGKCLNARNKKKAAA